MAAWEAGLPLECAAPFAEALAETAAQSAED